MIEVTQNINRDHTGDFDCVPEPIPDALATELQYRVPIACL